MQVDVIFSHTSSVQLQLRRSPATDTPANRRRRLSDHLAAHLGLACGLLWLASSTINAVQLSFTTGPRLL